MAVSLRYYQRDAIIAAEAHLQNKTNNPCIVIPTAGGKSLVMAGIVERWGGSGARICILAHTQELVKQNYEKFKMLCPDADAGIYQAALGKRDTEHQIIFAGIQSVSKKAMELGRFDVFLIDEADLIPLDGDGQYRTFINESKSINPNLRIVGLTATPFRLKGGMVVGDDYILNEIAYDVGVRELMNKGYLCQLTTKLGNGAVDNSGLHTRAGDFIASEMAERYDREDIVAAACADIKKRTKDRNSVIIFGVNVDHCFNIAAHFDSVEVVHGGTPKVERERIVNDFSDGKIKHLVNVNVLSVGFDAPRIDCVALLRPTQSARLMYQQIGRGLRLHESKSDCLILDYGGNIERLGPIDNLQVEGPKKKREGEGVPPGKVCPECQELVFTLVKICPCCDYEWPVEVSKPGHETVASDFSILSETKSHDIDNVLYFRHEKGDNVGMRVEYCQGMKTIAKEWVCIEYIGFARRKAEQWWSEWGIGECPATADEAIAMEKKAPKGIRTTKRGKYTEIVSYIV